MNNPTASLPSDQTRFQVGFNSQPTIDTLEEFGFVQDTIVGSGSAWTVDDKPIYLWGMEMEETSVRTRSDLQLNFYVPATSGGIPSTRRQVPARAGRCQQVPFLGLMATCPSGTRFFPYFFPPVAAF